SWYQNGGRDSAIRIDLPKGGYVPAFMPAPKEESAEAQATSAENKPRRPQSIVWLSATLGLMVLVTAALILRRSEPATDVSRSRLFTAYPGYQTSPAFSPDGLTVAFSWGGPTADGKPAIYVQSLNADAPRKLTNSSQRDRNPVWLSDGQRIAFL